MAVVTFDTSNISQNELWALSKFVLELFGQNAGESVCKTTQPVEDPISPKCPVIAAIEEPTPAVEEPVTVEPEEPKAKRGRKPKVDPAVEQPLPFEEPVAAPATTSPMVYTLDQLREGLTNYSVKHGTDKAIELLADFGKARVSELLESTVTEQGEFMRLANA